MPGGLCRYQSILTPAPPIICLTVVVEMSCGRTETAFWNVFACMHFFPYRFPKSLSSFCVYRQTEMSFIFRICLCGMAVNIYVVASTIFIDSFFNYYSCSFLSEVKTLVTLVQYLRRPNASTA